MMKHILGVGASLIHKSPDNPIFNTDKARALFFLSFCGKISVLGENVVDFHKFLKFFEKKCIFCLCFLLTLIVGSSITTLYAGRV